MTYKEKTRAVELRQKILKHVKARERAEHFLNTVDEKIRLLHQQIAELKAYVEPMKEQSQHSERLRHFNVRALEKLMGKCNTKEKLAKYRKRIRALEREIARG